MYRLQVKTHFDAAHFIGDYVGKCRNLHGHRWEVELVVEGEQLDKCNILVDFGDLKKDLKDYLDKGYDHALLNDTLQQDNVTAELLAYRIFHDFEHRIPIFSKLVRVTVWESPECCVKYYKEGRK